jgi:hypothetical protein
MLNSQRFLAFYLAQSRRIWKGLPEPWRAHSLGQAYGRHLHRLVRLHSRRSQSHATFFFRNRAELTLLCRLLDRKVYGSSVNIAVLACSKGAEVYSIASAIRCSRPDLKIRLHAVDVSREIVEFAARGVYSLAAPPGSAANPSSDWDATWRDQPIFEEQPISMLRGMTGEEVKSMLEIRGDQAKIQPWLKEGILWLEGDANDPQLAEVLTPQDIVVANRFLCHMRPGAARACLRKVARLLKPGGYLFVSGVDLDVRVEVAREMRWHPVTDLLQEVHEGDLSLLNGWPLEYWGLEPFSNDRPDRQIRYASVFQAGAVSTGKDQSRNSLSSR